MTINIDSLDLPDEIAAEVERLTATYEFEKLSEKGQNGYLFIARNSVIDRRVAIKFYFWADGTREHVEPKTLAAVKSGSVVEVLDASLVGEEWAMFVTPFCTNGDLDRYRESHRFGLKEGLTFASRLLEGVAALHQWGFVHRDLKPENLLVSDARGPLIADFGPVRLIPEGQEDVSGSGHAVLYRPPESFQTARYDRRGDLYQCGMVLYQLLGGRLPYAYQEYLSDSKRAEYAAMQDDFERFKLVESAIRKKANDGTLLDLNTLPFFTPSSVKAAIRRATSVDPADRFQTASDFMSKLNSLWSKLVDWRYDGRTPIAHCDGTQYRVVSVGSKFVVEQNRGNGWRKVPKADAGTLKQQVRFLEKRCLG